MTSSARGDREQFLWQHVRSRYPVTISRSALIYARSQAQNTNTKWQKSIFEKKKIQEMGYKFPTYFEWDADSHLKFFHAC